MNPTETTSSDKNGFKHHETAIQTYKNIAGMIFTVHKTRFIVLPTAETHKKEGRKLFG